MTIIDKFWTCNLQGIIIYGTLFNAPCSTPQQSSHATVSFNRISAANQYLFFPRGIDKQKLRLLASGQQQIVSMINRVKFQLGCFAEH